MLRIEVDDPVLYKPPPKKPAPRVSRPPSIASSNHHSVHSVGSQGSSTSSPSTMLSPKTSGGVKILKPTLDNISSDPAMWSANESRSMGALPSHHRPFRSHQIEPRSMPGIEEIRDEVEIDDIDDQKEEEEEDTNNNHPNSTPRRSPQLGNGASSNASDSENMEILDEDEDSKDSKSDGTGDDSNTLYPKMVQTHSTPGNITPNGTHSQTTGYVSRRKKNRSFGNGRRISHSHSRSTGMLEIPPPSPVSASGSHSPSSSMFYVFRSSPSDNAEKENVNNDKGYNANASLFAQRYKRNGANHKYTDSVIGSLKNGVVSMWGGSKSGAKAAGSRTPLMHYGAASVGYPVSTYPLSLSFFEY